MRSRKIVSDINVHKTSICGHRPTNEDYEVIDLNITPKTFIPYDDNFAPIDLFIICDGHGGSEVAKFVGLELKKILREKELRYPLLDTYIYRVCNHIQQELKIHPGKIADGCGCTALVMIRYIKNREKALQIINIGDCRAVISEKGFAIPLTKDHKPDWPEEKVRIDGINIAHGKKEKIYFGEGAWRIGDLSVSRSFGDLDNVPYVTHKPDIFHRVLRPNEYDFIIMACDGLWDVIRNEEAVNFVRDHLWKNHIYTYNIPGKYPQPIENENNIARKLAEYAKARGSTDNISILIIIPNFD